MKSGVVAGYETVDFKATVIDGSYHEVDSSEMAFKIAGSMAFKEGMKKANPVLLEPIMDVEVEVPNEGEYVGAVMSSITQRRGLPVGNDAVGNSVTVHAVVPLAEMFGYITDLRSATQGRGDFSMFPKNYQEVPKFIADEIAKARLSNN